MGFPQTCLAAAVALVVALVPRSVNGSDTASDLVRVESSDEIMGTTFSVVLYGRDRVTLETAARSALDEAQRLDRMLSNYRPDSEWSEVNRAAPAGAGRRFQRNCFSCSPSAWRQPSERRRVRHHGGTSDEGLGLLQGRRPATAKG